MNYGSNEAAQIALTIRFDNALQNPAGGGGGGVGISVGRSLGDVATGVGIAQ